MKPYLAMIFWEDMWSQHTTPFVLYAASMEAAQAQAHNVADKLPFGSVESVEEL
jgi:hypothetical protein